MTQGLARTAIRHRSKFVGIYYLLTIFMGTFVLFFHGRQAFAADLVATTFFLALTAFFYGLSRPIPGKNGRTE